MELRAVISGIEGLKAKGTLDLDITSVESDSRKITKNSIYNFKLHYNILKV